ncbi:Protein of unknown function [Gryllus bimaculatus]|nr:Protein of unknown function [Gryllus bimaculatus]
MFATRPSSQEQERRRNGPGRINKAPVSRVSTQYPPRFEGACFRCRPFRAVTPPFASRTHRALYCPSGAQPEAAPAANCTFERSESPKSEAPNKSLEHRMATQQIEFATRGSEISENQILYTGFFNKSSTKSSKSLTKSSTLEQREQRWRAGLTWTKNMSDSIKCYVNVGSIMNS